MKHEQFDEHLAAECAQSFSVSTGLGCTLSDQNGQLVCEHGYGYEACQLCTACCAEKKRGLEAHIYSMNEAERFGGRYIYFCPMGLSFFVSPIVGAQRVEGKITAGPFTMVEKQDFLDYELAETAGLSPPMLEAARAVLENIPFVPPERVNHLSKLLFLAVSFLNDFSAENRMISADRSDALQGQINAYILEMKQQETPPPYPFETEHALLQSISRRDSEEAQRLLNELFGAILFSSGGNLEEIKSRLYELLVLISRTVIDGGTEPERVLSQTHEYRRTISSFTKTEDLCYWLSGVVRSLASDLFSFADAKHAEVIRRCTQYIGNNYSRKISLEELARMVYLSPAYLSRIFKKETGVSFRDYLNRVRISKAQELLRIRQIRMTDISLMVGFEDQSHFTRVFKRVTGTLPRVYREKMLPH